MVFFQGLLMFFHKFTIYWAHFKDVKDIILLLFNLFQTSVYEDTWYKQLSVQFLRTLILGRFLMTDVYVNY